MKTFPGKAGFLIAILSVFLMANLTLGGHATAAPPHRRLFNPHHA